MSRPKSTLNYPEAGTPRDPYQWINGVFGIGEITADQAQRSLATPSPSPEGWFVLNLETGEVLTEGLDKPTAELVAEGVVVP